MARGDIPHTLSAFRKILTKSKSGKPVTLSVGRDEFYKGHDKVDRSIGEQRTHTFVLHNNFISKYGTSSNNTYLEFPSRGAAYAAWQELLQGLIVKL